MTRGLVRPDCDRCNDAKVVTGDTLGVTIPCPACCIVTDEPDLDLSADAISDPPPAFNEDEVPTGKILQSLNERPTPRVEPEIPPAAVRPRYERELARLTPLPIPDSLKHPRKP